MNDVHVTAKLPFDSGLADTMSVLGSDETSSSKSALLPVRSIGRHAMPDVVAVWLSKSHNASVFVARRDDDAAC